MQPFAPPCSRRLAYLAASALVVGALARWGGELTTLLRDREHLEAWLAARGAWAPLASVALGAGKAVLVVLPGQLLALANGWLFGFWLGGLLTYLGVMAGSALAIVLARRFGRPLVARLLPADRLARVDDLARRRGAPFFALLLLLPLTPDDLACWAIGLTRLPLARMFAVIALTRVPGVALAAWLGAHAGRLGPAGWVALGAVGTALLGGYLLRRERLELLVWRWLERAREPSTGATRE